MKVITLLSGGLDSTVLLAKLKSEGNQVRCLAFDYGQRHVKELECAKKVASHYDVPYQEIDLSQLASLMPGSSQTDRSIEVPHGHYASESMKLTVVPNRNMIMLSIAAGIAIANDFDQVSFAAHSGDHAIYPDCRNEFVGALEEAVNIGNYRRIAIHPPFIFWSKDDIVRAGKAMSVPFNLTWSCYEGNELHCGKCGTCVERKEAFQLAEVDDPTEYVR